MSVVLSIACEPDASYPFKTTGTAESTIITGQCEAGYYLSVVEKGGEPAGIRRLGLEWAYRPVTKGRVSAGFPKKAVAQFSSRRAQITKTTLAFAEPYEKGRRHALDQRALASRGRFANSMTRRTTGPGPLDFTALLHCWERASRVAELETLRDLARTVWHSAPTHGMDTDAPRNASYSRMSARLASRSEPTHAQERAVMAVGLARAQESRAGRCAARHRPRATTGAATRVRGWRLGERSG